MKIAIVDYGMGNIHSVLGVLKHLGISEVTVTDSYEVLAKVDKLILSGVGSPDAFEVGPEVRAAFTAARPEAAACFSPRPGGKWLAHLPALARQRLAALGIPAWGNDGSPAWCTFN